MAKKIVLYSTTGCPLCARYRSLLEERKHPFEERNTTDNPTYLSELASKGIMVLPTVFVGEDVVTGFRPNTLLEKLAA
jgi:glutaredoxin